MTERAIYLGPLTDSRRWDQVTLRPDDVIVVSPPKCGTTWMQTIIALLLAGDPDITPEFSVKMPWVDIRVRDMTEVAERLEAMTHRRSMKSHTPMDGLPLHDAVRYICVFRHPLDAHFSFRNYVRNLPVSWFDAWYPQEDTAGDTFRHFLAGGPDGDTCDAMPLAHILQHYEAARALSHQPGVSLFHYADMKRDLPGVFDRLCALLGISYPPPVMARLVEAAGFENMRRNADRFAPSGGKGFFKSDADFFRSGTNGTWQGQLTQEELAAYDAIMSDRLSPEDRRWLEYGSGSGEGGTEL
ncbi:sulfotransferase domain-containing protein [Pseudooceanicola sp. C21-150M6]|uniref:sulfotransferase domain-containing protein n=1 Tax=Pseudooceanicola sp. C21-150M6 TaxID=3434355 RepID=UPI003D7F84D4